jgi:dienelactone hydrolase
VLVLHGGGSHRGDATVSPAQLSVLRMIPIANRIAHQGHGQLAVFRLLNSARGWDTSSTPVDDARWALDQIRNRHYGPLPTALVGHSLGGRAALLTAAEPEVTTVVALAPWVYPTDGAAGALDRRILLVHGSADRIASPTNAVAVARTLSKTCRVAFVCVGGGSHAMLRHRNRFDGLAADFVTGTLLNDKRSGPIANNLLEEAWTTA